MSAADVTNLKANYRNYRPVIDIGFRKFWWISWISIFRPTPTKVVCITVLTGNHTGVNCPLWPAATPSSEL